MYSVVMYCHVHTNDSDDNSKSDTSNTPAVIQVEPDTSANLTSDVDVDGQANDMITSQNDSRDQPQLVDSHRFRQNWSAWLLESVEQLEAMSTSPKWRSTLSCWLDMEEALGYLSNRVCPLGFD